MLLELNQSRLVLVDYQARLMPVIDRADDRLAQAIKLAQLAQLLGVETVGTEQNPAGLGANDARLKALCSQTFEKTHFAAFRQSEPQRWLSSADQSQLVLAGCEAHVCLLQTALSALELGYRVGVVEDACGSRRASDHLSAMNRLRQAGVQVVSFEMVAFEWLRDCEHPKFRAALALLR